MIKFNLTTLRQLKFPVGDSPAKVLQGILNGWDINRVDNVQSCTHNCSEKTMKVRNQRE